LKGFDAVTGASRVYQILIPFRNDAVKAAKAEPMGGIASQ
jgi:hypothetical protein